MTGQRLVASVAIHDDHPPSRHFSGPPLEAGFEGAQQERMPCNAWKKNVAEFEQGYTVGLDDYTNDLGPRQSLAEVLEAARGEARERLLAVVSKIDERFMRSTVSVTPALVSIPEPWAQRVPTRRSRELDQDLQERGYRFLE